ncbi:MAG: DEAD/DEAH box helicase [Myxococcales bacterium]
MDLRDYQVRAIEGIRSRIRAGKKRVLLVSPTGSGKTVTAAEVIRSAVSRGTKVVFLAHRRELINQCSAKLDSFGVEHGIIQGSHPRYRPWEPVQVASVQTLRKRERKPEAQLIVVDEAHHARAATYERIFAAYPQAPILGLTATPWRTDGKGLGDLFEDVVVAATPAELVEQGHLVPCDGYAFDAPDLSKVKVTAGDYDEGELGELMSGTKLVGNIVQQWLAHAGGVRTVVFAVHVAHSKQLVEQFRASGVAAEHVDGEMPVEEREAILARLKSGETRVVSNCQILTEGWDLPELGCVIMARPTKSVGLYLQCVGRGLRPAPGKLVARLHDHAGCAFEHGLPTDDRDYSLEGSPVKKRGAKGAPAPSVRTCERCFALYPPALEACPRCGLSNAKRLTQVIEVEGTAIPLSEVKTYVKTDERSKRNLYMHLLRTAQEKGRKLGWAWHVYKDKFNEPPPREWLAEFQRSAVAAKASAAGEAVPA